MRLSRTAWLVLGAGIFVIAFACLYMVYSRQVGEQAQLEESLAANQAQLPQLISDREDLEGQLAQWKDELAKATSSLNQAKARLAVPVDSTEYDDILFSIADECDLEIAAITASEPSDEELDGITYVATSFEVTVQAAGSPPGTVDKFETYIDETVAGILDFVTTIATGEDFTTTTVEVVTMENLEPPDDEEVEEAEKPSATIELIIYSYQGG